MANTKEVRKQIASIKSTQKITSAMEMVAAYKMTKNQDAMLVGQTLLNKNQGSYISCSYLKLRVFTFLFRRKENKESLLYYC